MRLAIWVTLNSFVFFWRKAAFKLW